MNHGMWFLINFLYQKRKIHVFAFISTNWIEKRSNQFTLLGWYFTLGNRFAHPGKNITHPFCYLRGKWSFDWFYQYLCTGEHFQSGFDIFQFDFKFVKPRDVPPLEWDFDYNSSCFHRVGVVKRSCFDKKKKSHFSLYVKAKQRRHIVWFH